MDDRELLQLMQKNPENGIRLAMRQYTGLCYYIVQQKLSGQPKEEVEECVSDVFLAFYHQYQKIDLEKGSIRCFLAVLARRKAIDRLRKLTGRETVPLEEGWTGENPVQKQEERQRILDAVNALEEPDNKILILKYYFGYPTKMIAAALGLKENTVDQKARRGLEKVRKLLEGGA